MKNLHIFKNVNEKFSEPYIEFINKNFNDSEHFFYHIGQDKRTNKVRRKNITFVTKLKYFILVKDMYKTERIFLHGLFSPHIVIILFIQPWLLKKCYWIVWGGDLYYYNRKKTSLKAYIYEGIRKVVIRNMGGIITLVKGDYDLAKKWYKVKGKYYKGQYVNTEKVNIMEKIINHNSENNIDKNEFLILVGNSATKSNFHMEVLDLLKKFKNENINIICPLSYGDMDYAKEVINYGKKIYGNKFIALEKFMNITEYMKLLNTIDIGIFNNNRQQAMGNISSLLYLGKKVYMRPDTTMYYEMNDTLKLNIFDINNIENENFNEFVCLDEEAREANRKIVQNKYYNNNIKSIWKNIFDS